MSLADEGIRIAVAITGGMEPQLRRISRSRSSGNACDRGRRHPIEARPEVYLRALETLNVPAENPLAVEDSELGLRAATAAGLAPAAKGTAMVRAGFDGVEPLM